MDYLKHAKGTSVQMNPSEVTQARILEISDLLPKFLGACSSQMTQVATLLTDVFRAGNKVLISGNGGSAADSQHFAAELVSAFSKDLKRNALPAIALTVDTSILTAFSNDFGFEGVFARQVEAYGQAGDTLIVLTTSGSSKNCLKAVEVARAQNLKTVAFTRTSGDIAAKVDVAIEVPSNNTQHIQECHMIGYHIISELIETALFESGRN